MDFETIYNSLDSADKELIDKHLETIKAYAEYLLAQPKYKYKNILNFRTNERTVNNGTEEKL